MFKSMPIYSLNHKNHAADVYRKVMKDLLPPPSPAPYAPGMQRSLPQVNSDPFNFEMVNEVATTDNIADEGAPAASVSMANFTSNPIHPRRSGAHSK
jgi:hypothetical protein